MARVTKNEYEPLDVSPPGESLADILEERGMTQAELARRMGRPVKTINEIVKGKAMIVPETAIQLERTLGAPAEFWLAREARYREAVARLEDEARLQEEIGWLKDLPLKQMTDWGWVEKFSDKAQQVAECLRFFGVSSVEVWRKQCAESVAAFRMSQSTAAQTGAVATWLRRGVLETSKIDCHPWSPKTLRTHLPKIRSLTIESDPKLFLPALRTTLASAGVAFALVRHPKKCPASGATMFTSKDRAMMLLSARYLADDQLWFSVFHEIGHLILHGKKGGTFLEGMNRTDPREDEADQFAKNIIVPIKNENELQALSNKKAAIRAFAAKIGVAPGLVVGRLQHEKRLPFSHCNDLKTRYTWNTDSE